MKTSNSKRYYLHRKIKEKGIKYNPFLRTVYWAWNQTLEDNHVLRLRDEYNYSVQTEIN
ncbi:hypothetical protein PL373_08030 [Tenacibaculum maritimum]|nr:hypothetical protein [Tenacibaculum maritimum]MDB0601094.1 hypothetical protein [Tenacibaculum maritimum]MDB0612175.1 hypothetical protein [Tenacibaculum maritimum]